MPPRSNHNIPDRDFIQKVSPEALPLSAEDTLNQATRPPRPNMPDGAAYSEAEGATQAFQTANDNEPPADSTNPQSASVSNDPHPNRKISNATAALMITTSIVFDLIGMIPFVGLLTSGFAAPLVFGMWFVSLGVPLITPKKMASWGLSWLAELIPAVSEILPMVTVGVVLVIIIDRVEEKTGLNISSLAKGDVKDLASIKKNLGGQIKSRFTGATPPPMPAGEAANDNSQQSGATSSDNVLQFPGNNSVPQRPQMVDNISNRKSAA